MNTKIKLIISLVLLSFLSLGYSNSNNYFTNTPYQVCFTPGQNCTGLITQAIYDAQQSIYVQAYSFTSKPIISALVSAEHRGVKVTILLDRSNASHKYSGLSAIESNHIPDRIDYKVSIAHNKVMIIDKSVVITGSFNFTKSAQYHNAENVMIIYNKKLAQQYLDNFWRRWNVSESVNTYCSYKACHY
jgi:phosphatidylserine/phosphatidylglycerophosphate/cardiolipin synthase-like enzyme